MTLIEPFFGFFTVLLLTMAGSKRPVVWWVTVPITVVFDLARAGAGAMLRLSAAAAQAIDEIAIFLPFGMLSFLQVGDGWLEASSATD